LSEQQRSSKSGSRTYRMGKRAELVDGTRQRIVEATVHLHGTVGPAHATVAGIAEQAGVTRLTVYRHFPDEDALFAACTAHWASQQHLPDVKSWLQLDSPEERVKTALDDVYRFFDEAQDMLTLVTRDREAIPEFVREHNRLQAEAQIDALLGAWPKRRRSHSRRALIGHALSFTTWRSLCVEEGLCRPDAVAAMTRLVVEV
jgi:AcrR family transcriptional regulator